MNPYGYVGNFVPEHYENAYSNILQILQPKKENFQTKNSDIFHIFLLKT